MGNDGGSIPTRRELVKEAARDPNTTQVKEVQKEQQAHRWSTCPLSNRRLACPIVSDSSGTLYNKDAVLQFLLPVEATTIVKEDCEAFLQGRIRSLRDVVEVLFEVESTKSTDSEKWLCPVTAKALGPNVKSVYLTPCGHAFSREAIREMKGDKCVQCDTLYEQDNIITILPLEEEEQDKMAKRIANSRERGLTHSLKKAPGSRKKRKANGPQESVVKSSQPETNGLDKKAESHAGDVKRSSTIKDGATASLTAKVLEEEAARTKRKKLVGENENLKSLFRKSDNATKHRDGDFMTRGFTVPAGKSR